MYDEKLAKKIRENLNPVRGVTEKKMFGGICFLLHGNMFCGVEKDNLIVRVGPDQYEHALKYKYVTEMDMTGRPLKGIVYVRAPANKRKDTIDKWLTMGLGFAKSLPRK